MLFGSNVLNLCCRLRITNKIHFRKTHLKRNDPIEERTINQVSLCGRVSNFPLIRKNILHPYVMFTMVTNTTHKAANGGFITKNIIHNIRVKNPKLIDTIYKSLRPDQPVFVLGKLSIGEVKLGYKHSAVKALIEAEDIIFDEINPDDINDK